MPKRSRRCSRGLRSGAVGSRAASKRRSRSLLDVVKIPFCRIFSRFSSFCRSYCEERTCSVAPRTVFVCTLRLAVVACLFASLFSRRYICARSYSDPTWLGAIIVPITHRISPSIRQSLLTCYPNTSMNHESRNLGAKGAARKERGQSIDLMAAG